MKQLSIQEKIYKSYTEGVGISEIAYKYNLPSSAVKNMINREKTKQDRKLSVTPENQLLLNAIKDLPTKHPQRIYNALRRIGVGSLEELKKISPEYLYRCNGLGVTSVSLLESAGLTNK